LLAGDGAAGGGGGGGGGRPDGGAGARYFLTADDTPLTDDELGGGGARYLTGLGGSAGFCGRVISDVIMTSLHVLVCMSHKPRTCSFTSPVRIMRA